MDEMERPTASTGSVDAYARSMEPVLRDMQRSGITGLRAIARELEARKVPTARGGKWSPMQVGNLLNGLEALRRRQSAPRAEGQR